MLDKRKVRLMTKLALYEQKEGREDMKISAYYKKDYISMKTVATILWTTVGYGCVILLIGLAAMNSLLENVGACGSSCCGLCGGPYCDNSCDKKDCRRKTPGCPDAYEKV